MNRLLTEGNLNCVIKSLFPLLQGDVVSRGHQIQVDVRYLIQNGFEVMDPGGKVIIRTYQRDDSIILEMQDTVPGIPDEVMNKWGTLASVFFF